MTSDSSTSTLTKQLRKSYQLILLKMHPLNDVATVIKNSFDVFGVYSASEVRVAIVLAVPGRR